MIDIRTLAALRATFLPQLAGITASDLCTTRMLRDAVDSARHLLTGNVACQIAGLDMPAPPPFIRKRGA